MKKLLLFLTVLVFFGNTVNAQEMKKQLKTAKSVSLTQISDKAAVAGTTFLDQNINMARVTRSVLPEQKTKRTGVAKSALDRHNADMQFMKPAHSSNRVPSRAPGDIIFSENFEASSSMAYNPVATGWLCMWGDDSYPWFTHADFAHNSTMGMGMQWDEEDDKNALAITPGFSLTAGVTYSVKFWLKMGYNASDGDDFAVTIGRTRTVDGMLNNYDFIIYDAVDVFTNGWVLISQNFTPTTGGTYYLGFYGYTPAYYGDDIMVDDISVVDASTATSTDAAIIAIINPVSGTNLTANETVTVTIKNNGTSAITSINLELKVNGNVIATETRPGNIAAGATANYTFNAKANLSAAGSHTIAVRAILAGDQNSANDSFSATVINTICGVSSLPFTQNFNNETDYPLCWTMISNNTINAYDGTSDYTMGVYRWADNPADHLFMFSSYSNVSGMAADRYYQYLISPELPANNGLYVTFNSLTFDSDEILRIGYSSTTNNVTAFTWLEPDMLEAGYGYNHAVTLPEGTKYFALNYMGNNNTTMLIIDDIVIDNMPLSPVSVTPDEDAINVAIDAEVSVTFNYDITANNLSGISINGVTVTPSISGKKLIISHSNFAYNTTYTVNILAGAIYGYTEAISWSFSTENQNSIPVINGNEINIYQNNGEIFIKVSEKSEIRLLDIYGRVLANRSVDANSTLNIPQPSGIYLIEVKHNGNVSTHKVVVR